VDNVYDLSDERIFYKVRCTNIKNKDKLMTLIQSWADSLTLLKPKNLQLFVMVTIKSIIEAYKLYFRYFWWVIHLMVVEALFPYYFQLPEYALYNSSYNHVFFFISCWLYELLFLVACFSTRPSILQKDSAYFWFQLKRIALFWIFVPIFSWSSATYYGYIFTVLFFADSEGGPKSFLLSLWNAIKMVVFNLPLMMILGGVVYLIGWLGGRGLEQLMVAYGMSVYPQFFLLFNILGALLLPIGVCLYTNIYIKKLHDQFDLYFNKA
jgi:hypothetical protein